VFELNEAMTVYVHRLPVDFRKSVNGLSALVEQDLRLDVFANACFVFRNKRADKVKILFWQKNGFWLCYKRLEQERFIWPKSDTPVIPLSLQQLRWLLAGFNLNAMRGHGTASYQRAS
jgi:transposase